MATNHPHFQPDHAPKLQIYQHNPFITQSTEYDTANRNYSQNQNQHHNQNQYNIYTSTSELQQTHSNEQTPSAIPCSLVSIRQIL